MVFRCQLQQTLLPNIYPLKCIFSFPYRVAISGVRACLPEHCRHPAERTVFAEHAGTWPCHVPLGDRTAEWHAQPGSQPHTSLSHQPSLQGLCPQSPHSVPNLVLSRSVIPHGPLDCRIWFQDAEPGRAAFEKEGKLAIWTPEADLEKREKHSLAPICLLAATEADAPTQAST